MLQITAFVHPDHGLHYLHRQREYDTGRLYFTGEITVDPMERTIVIIARCANDDIDPAFRISIFVYS